MTTLAQKLGQIYARLGGGGPRSHTLASVRDEAIRLEFEATGYHCGQTVENLGIARSTLTAWLNKKRSAACEAGKFNLSALLIILCLLPVANMLAQEKGATKLLTLAAQPSAPTAITVSPVAPVSVAPTPQRLSNLVPVTLSWTAAADPSVVGYRALWHTNSAATTNTSIVLRVAVGVTNTYQVVSVDALGVESLPSNSVQFRATNLPQATLTTAVWSYSTAGYFGQTNRIQTSTNLTDWITRLTFVGRGFDTNVWRTNTTQEFFRTTTIN